MQASAQWWEKTHAFASQTNPFISRFRRRNNAVHKSQIFVEIGISWKTEHQDETMFFPMRQEWQKKTLGEEMSKLSKLGLSVRSRTTKASLYTKYTKKGHARDIAGAAGKLLGAASVACLLGAVGAIAGDFTGGGGQKKGPLFLKQEGVIEEGGVYDNPSNPTTMSGQMYVFYQIPSGYRWGQQGVGAKYPIIMIHGGGQTGSNFLGTPDGRPGWAQFFAENGWPAFVIDQPGRGKSGYFPNAYGPQGPNPSPATVKAMFTAPELTVPLQWPQAALHTQWPGGPGSGVPGEYAYDQFFATQVASMPNGDQAIALTVNAVTALIKDIGPSIIITHSMSGPMSWFIPQANPGKIKAVIAVEPGGDSSLTPDAAPPNACGITNVCLNYSPPVSGPADLHLVFIPPPDASKRGCWLQSGSVIHKITGLAGIPILVATGQASYHATYDYCTSEFLTQAGVKHEHIPLATVGILGNGHMEMLEMNNLTIAAFYQSWLASHLQ
jgi:pimeloyl-ACP methyl ester carboxylesterase